MTVIYCGLALFVGYAAGFLTCWLIARTRMNEFAAIVGYDPMHDE
jgi:hypothetical protein